LAEISFPVKHDMFVMFFFCFRSSNSDALNCLSDAHH